MVSRRPEVMRVSTPKAVSEPKTPGTGPAFRLPFDNSFFLGHAGVLLPWKPEPSRAPAWVQFNDALALELGLEPATLKSRRALSGCPAGSCRLRRRRWRRPTGETSSASSRHTWGRPRLAAPGNSSTRQDSVGEPGPQGVGPYAVFAPWRWQGGTGPGAARVPSWARAMHALGIPTTRALRVIWNRRRVNREGFPPGRSRCAWRPATCGLAPLSSSRRGRRR